MPPPPPPPTTSTSNTKPPPKSDYIETDTGNKVARRSQLHGTQHIILGGRAVIQPQVCIRGDLMRTTTTLPPPSSSSSSSNTTTTKTTNTNPSSPSIAVSIGRYSFISTNTILRPPHKPSRSAPASGSLSVNYHTLRIGEHVHIERDCVIEAAVVGDRVHIGAGSVLGRFVIVKDGVRVLPGAVVPGGMVVPSGSVVGGRPARVVGEVGDGWGVGGGGGGDLREMWRGVG